MTYAQALAFINSFSHSGTPVHDLHRIAGLMEQLGNPQERLQFIHIAGTNGKGSVAEYLGNILLYSGYKTGVFTSPYIRCYEDRIRLNGENLPQDMLCRLCEMVAEVVVGDEGYSQFEITFAIAMLYYTAVHAEIVVLETGMGGLLDCTNIIAPPLCSVITSVSLDHMAILGDTIEKIAAQKAGIIKSGSPAVMAVMSDVDAVRLITETAKQQGSPVYSPDMTQCEQPACGIAGNQFVYRQKKYRTKMSGVHQIHNALTALTVVDVLREQSFSISEQAVQCGLYETQCPGRTQILQEIPLVLLDVGHTAEGVTAFV
ncbi:MAG: bifunctional folylpolyglutamate synthase/dihydrofolate synthase, partial [Oscillospiraceae bacterium]|nr:bifunctional folylpolyglutamate synthase/dihydrofolate synthase [Oscillospiraceae bacterium]